MPAVTAGALAIWAPPSGHTGAVKAGGHTGKCGRGPEQQGARPPCSPPVPCVEDAGPTPQLPL